MRKKLQQKLAEIANAAIDLHDGTIQMENLATELEEHPDRPAYEAAMKKAEADHRVWVFAEWGGVLEEQVEMIVEFAPVSKKYQVQEYAKLVQKSRKARDRVSKAKLTLLRYGNPDAIVTVY